MATVLDFGTRILFGQSVRKETRGPFFPAGAGMNFPKKRNKPPEDGSFVVT